jgi:type VI secretion system secreted protein Hcp
MAPPGELGGMIIGTSVAKGHENEIEVFSYSEGISSCSPNAQKGGGLGACKASVSDLSIMTKLSPGYNQLRALTFTGKKLLSADLVFEKRVADGRAVFFKIHMEDIAVTSAQESGSAGGDDTPTISISFAPSRIAWAIYQQKADGSLELANTFGINVATNALWNYTF